MYQLLAFLTGAILALVISINGNLSTLYGAFLASAIIHFVGTVFGGLLCCFDKNKEPLFKWGPKWIYLGGAIGVVMNIANNLAYGKISVTAIIALELLGQTLTSLAIDSFGLFGSERRPFKKSTCIVLVFAVAGMAVMLDRSVFSAVIAVGLSIIAGATIVLQRIVNARLADKIGTLKSSFVNHLTGLPLTIVLAAIMVQQIPRNIAFDSRIWIYTGGIIGVIIVVLCNVTVPKLSTFKQTVLSFLGQVFAGVAIDLVIGVEWSKASFYGGLIIAAGMLVNYVVESLEKKKTPM